MAGKRKKGMGDGSRPVSKRAKSRATSLVREQGIPPTRARRAASALLAESDARTHDSALRSRDDTIERRTSDLATPPPSLPS